MSDGMTIAAASMQNDMQRLNILSQNIANALTPAYKRDLAVTSGFSAFMAGGAGQLQEMSLPGFSAATDFSTAVMRNSGNPLDLAIEDGSFFEVSDDRGTYYTRHGSFMLDARGQLVTASGERVAGVSGDIQLGNAHPVIDRQGRVLENGELVAQIKLVRFADSGKLIRAGAGKYLQGDALIDATAADGSLRQGFLEASNVSTSSEMVRLIETMRHFEGGQKVIRMYDEMLDRAISKLGEF